jgi:hypothetical protein
MKKYNSINHHTTTLTDRYYLNRPPPHKQLIVHACGTGRCTLREHKKDLCTTGGDTNTEESVGVMTRH